MRLIAMASLLLLTGCAATVPPPSELYSQPWQVVGPNDAAPVAWTVDTSTAAIRAMVKAHDEDVDVGGLIVQTTPPSPELLQRIVSPQDIPYHIICTKRVWLTVYDADPNQTDETPWIGASGRLMIPGDAASNGLRKGTRFRIPEIFGEKIFTVEDAMAGRHGPDDLDLWAYHINDAFELSRKYSLAHRQVAIEILGPPSSFSPP